MIFMIPLASHSKAVVKAVVQVAIGQPNAKKTTVWLARLSLHVCSVGLLHGLKVPHYSQALFCQCVCI